MNRPNIEVQQHSCNAVHPLRNRRFGRDVLSRCEGALIQVLSFGTLHGASACMQCVGLGTCARIQSSRCFWQAPAPCCNSRAAVLPIREVARHISDTELVRASALRSWGCKGWNDAGYLAAPMHPAVEFFWASIRLDAVHGRCCHPGAIRKSMLGQDS